MYRDKFKKRVKLLLGKGESLRLSHPVVVTVLCRDGEVYGYNRAIVEVFRTGKKGDVCLSQGYNDSFPLSKIDEQSFKSLLDVITSQQNLTNS